LQGRLWIILGGLSAAVAVILGAFAAHALKGSLSADMLTIYQTAHSYHIHHALGLILVGLLARDAQSLTWFNAAGALLFFGIILFSGSLYLLSVTGMRSLGMITPFGGMMFIIGWICLSLAVWQDKKELNS
jgi:uncharacterized membrane protein YgdD (TMEM256/DUF423 family)